MTQFSLLQTAYESGLNTSNAEFTLQVPELISLKNGTFTQQNALTKRYGFTRGNVDATAGVFKKLINDADKDLITIDTAGTVAAYTPSNPTGLQWAQKGILSTVVGYRSPITGIKNTVGSYDTLLMGNLMVVVYSAGDALPSVSAYYSVFDTVTGSMIVNNQSFGSPAGTTLVTGVKVVAIDSTHCALIAAYQNIVSGGPASLDIRWNILTISGSITLGSGHLLSTSDASLPTDPKFWDADGGHLIPAGATGFTLVLYDPDTANGTLYIKNITNAGAISSSTTTANWTTVAASRCIGVCSDKTSKLWIFTEQNKTIYRSLYTPSTGAYTVANGSTTKTTVYGPVERIGAVCEQPGVNQNVMVAFSGVLGEVITNTGEMGWLRLDSGATVLYQGKRYGGCIQSKPFIYNSIPYIQVIDGTKGASTSPFYSLQGTTTLLELTRATSSTSYVTSGTPRAQVASRQTASGGVYFDAVTSDFERDTQIGKVSIVGTKAYNIVLSSGLLRSNAPYTYQTIPEMVIWDWDYKFNYSASSIGGTTIIANGIPSFYDGSVVMEYQPLLYPEGGNVTMIATVPAGGLGANNYIWAPMYQLRDARGNYGRSFSTDIFKTVAGGDPRSASIKLPVYYNTTGNFIDAASALYYSPTGALYRSVGLNGATKFLTLFYGAPANTAASHVTVVDTYADSVLDKAPFIYSTGETGEFAPPCLLWVIAHKGRFWGIGDDKKTLWFTKQASYGVRPGFSDSFQLVISDDGKPLTAMATQDNYMVAFKEDSIWLVYGEGPNNAGGNFDLTTQKVPSDVGCINPRSVFANHLGVFFESRKGIMFLGRSQEIKYIGQRVQDLLDQYPVITGVVDEPSQSHVRFFCVNSESSPTSGMQLVYDYLRDRWTSFTIGNGAPIVAGVRYQGASKYLQTGAGGMSVTNFMWTEDHSTYLDNGAWVTMDVKTAWFKPGGPQGYCRVGKVGVLNQRVSAHGLTLELYKDYETNSFQTHTWSENLLTNQTIGQQVHLVPTTQEVEAMQLRLFDTAPNTLGTGQGATFVAIMLNAGLEPGEYRINPSYQS